MNYVPGHRCGSDLALLWLWHRPAAAALIRLLAWELPHATGMTKKKLILITNKHLNPVNRCLINAVSSAPSHHKPCKQIERFNQLIVKTRLGSLLGGLEVQGKASHMRPCWGWNSGKREWQRESTLISSPRDPLVGKQNTSVSRTFWSHEVGMNFGVPP